MNNRLLIIKEYKFFYYSKKMKLYIKGNGKINLNSIIFIVTYLI
jgi:hypothetical protein